MSSVGMLVSDRSAIALSEQHGGLLPVDCAEVESGLFSLAWQVYYALRGVRNDAVEQGIDYGSRETIAWESMSERSQVVGMSRSIGVPFVVASITEMFKAIPQVRDVRVTMHDDRAADFSVFVWMPEYDDALMDELVDAGIDADELARRYGYRIEYSFLPLPHVGGGMNGETDNEEILRR